MSALIMAAGVLGYLAVATVVMRADAWIGRRISPANSPAATMAIGLAWPVTVPAYVLLALLYGLYRIATWRLR